MNLTHLQGFNLSHEGSRNQSDDVAAIHRIQTPDGKVRFSTPRCRVKSILFRIFRSLAAVRDVTFHQSLGLVGNLF
jgi:hypothetical protein